MPRQSTARSKLLAAAVDVFREKGYAATSVEDLCKTAGVTKGAFFHHFDSKDALGVAAAHHWTQTTSAFFAQAYYHRHRDPLQRVLGYLDFRKAIMSGPVTEFTCLAGTLLQETYETHPAIREACDVSISGHAATLEADIVRAMQEHRLEATWTAQSLAFHIQAVLQGAFILAKARGGPEIAAASIDHLKLYVALLFATPGERRLPVSEETRS